MTVAASPRRTTTPRWLFLAFGAVLGLGLSSGLAALLVFSWPSGASGDDIAARFVVSIPPDLVPEPGADPVPFTEGKFWLVNLLPGEGQLPDDVAIDLGLVPQRPSAGGLLALWWRDPHFGCTVPWRPTFRFVSPPHPASVFLESGWFRNPCHGEAYTKAGLRVSGPSPRSLDTMQVMIQSDGRVDVHTDRITPGASDNPLRAVPYP